MFSQTELGSSSHSDFLNISGLKIQYEIIPSDMEADDAIDITVSDPQKNEEVQRAIADKLRKQHWFLSETPQAETLKQRYRITLSENHQVDIFNFREQELTETELKSVARTLKRLFDCLKDKSLWSLQSIQVKSKDQLNPKSGEDTRGLEVPEQHRFELFPAAFTEGKYQGKIETSWLEGTTLHEATHVCLEHALAGVWHQRLTELGWEEIDDALIELPGGITTTMFNREPQRCPSEYGSYQLDDDRAESVAQWIVDPTKLDSVRRELVETVLQENTESDIEPQIEKIEPVLPLFSGVVKVKVQPLVTAFKAGGRRTAGVPKPIIPLSEYRASRQITSNKDSV